MEHDQQLQYLKLRLSLAERLVSVIDLKEILTILLDVITEIFVETEAAFLLSYEEGIDAAPTLYMASPSCGDQPYLKRIREDMQAHVGRIESKMPGKEALLELLNTPLYPEAIKTMQKKEGAITNSFCVTFEGKENVYAVLHIATRRLKPISPDERQCIADLVYSAALHYQVIVRAIQSEVIHVKRFKQAVEAVGEGVAIFSPSKELNYWNPALLAMTGYTSLALGKMDFDTLFLPDQGDLQALKTAIDSQTMLLSEEYQLKTQTGEGLEISLSLYPVKEKKETRFFVAMIKNIRDRKRIETIQGEFDSFVSHQLRTPLSIIGTSASLLLEGMAGPVPQEQAEIIAKIKQNTEGVTTLIEDLLKMVHLQRGRIDLHPAPTDLRQLIEQETIGELKGWAEEKKCSIFFEMIGELPHEVSIDRVLLKQVMHNLLTNAVRYSPQEGGDIHVTLENQQGILECRVMDHGIGIPVEEQGKIFQKMYRASNAKQRDASGTGLGLYLAKVLVETAGGHIGFKRTDGTTTFYVRIPIEEITSQKASGESWT